MDLDYWSDRYPEEISPQLELDGYQSVTELFEEACREFADQPAFSCLGQSLSYRELERQSRAFAAYLQQETGLEPGDRIAVVLPNLLQFPIVVFGALRAGLVVVNTNPLYTVREMRHQFDDAGVRAVVVLANMAHKVQDVLPDTLIEEIIVTDVGDLLPAPKRWLVNAVLRWVKKQVPAYVLPGARGLRDVLRAGGRATFSGHRAGSDDLAVLQYTGGTTGLAKGVELSHRNLLANMLQAQRMMVGAMERGQELVVTPLPLYHIYAFTFHCMVCMSTGQHNLLIPNPRDLPAFCKTLAQYRFSVFVGLNTLFVALLRRADFRRLDFSALKVTLSGGMALATRTAEEWQALTGCPICEGYGLSECAPIVTVNPPSQIILGTIGLPLPGTSLKVIDDQGQEQSIGEAGELCVKGPQVMGGYWRHPEETDAVLDAFGWLRTGDIARIREDGYVELLDRKKDLIIVSGFNVYPNELEELVSQHPDVIQCAAIGVPDPKTGEAVKLFIVSDNKALDRAALVAFLRDKVTPYKFPHYVEHRDSLPTTPVGKVLRRALRDADAADPSEELPV